MFALEILACYRECIIGLDLGGPEPEPKLSLRFSEEISVHILEELPE
jgi:hypothetical protein